MMLKCGYRVKNAIAQTVWMYLLYSNWLPADNLYISAARPLNPLCLCLCLAGLYEQTFLIQLQPTDPGCEDCFLSGVCSLQVKKVQYTFIPSCFPFIAVNVDFHNPNGS